MQKQLKRQYQVTFINGECVNVYSIDLVSAIIIARNNRLLDGLKDIEVIKAKSIP